MHRSFLFLLAAAAMAPAADTMLYLGGWPKTVLVIDQAKQTVVDRIELKTDVPRTLTLSADKKKIFVTTMKGNGIEVVDLGTRKVTASFKLDEPNKQMRLSSVAVDPSDKFLYAMVQEITKKIDRFEVTDPKFAVVDIAQQKIVRTAEFPKDEAKYGFRGQMRVSPDGKYLYLFRSNILVLDTTDFKIVKKIDLSRSVIPGVDDMRLSLGDDPHDDPGVITSVFQSTDPSVHRTVFGIASVDLNQRSFDFTPIGPATAELEGLRLSPDKKLGYAVAVEGTHGNRRCEFWVFDMTTKKLIRKAEFPGRPRFYFALTDDGKKLMIFGAGFEVEFYDAQTLQLEKTLDVNTDVTTFNMIVVPGAATSVARQ